MATSTRATQLLQGRRRRDWVSGSSKGDASVPTLLHTTPAPTRSGIYATWNSSPSFLVELYFCYGFGKGTPLFISRCRTSQRYAARCVRVHSHSGSIRRRGLPRAKETFPEEQL